MKFCLHREASVKPVTNQGQRGHVLCCLFESLSARSGSFVFYEKMRVEHRRYTRKNYYVLKLKKNWKDEVQLNNK